MSPRPGHNLKKPRASKPKVKTGCKTCKKRHVKCDETKPECQRCANFGRKCDGYPSEDDHPPSKEPVHPVSRRLLSKALHEISPPPTILPMRATPISLQFQDDREYQYFCVFRDRTSIELAGGFEPTLWNRLVLQSCDNISIRELTTAVAALSLAGRHCTEARARRALDQQIDMQNGLNSHLQYALMQYGRALNRMQAMVSTGQDTIRVALIAALLIYVFENLHGDTDRAVTPIQSALELIVKRLSSIARPYRRPRTKPYLSPSPLPIDEDLLSAFMRIEGLSLRLARTKEQLLTYQPHQIFSMTYQTKDLDIPSCFATISEARLYLEDIQWRIAPGPNSTENHYSNPPDKKYWQSLGHKPQDLNTMRNIYREWYSAPINESALTAQYSQWHAAFEPLFEHSMTSTGAPSFVPATILYIQALTNNLLVQDFLHPSSQAQSQSQPRSQPHSQQAYHTTVQSILSLSRQLLDHPSFSRGFVFDVGIIPSLAVILMLCPDRELQWEAYDVARCMVPRREGVWDSGTLKEEGERLFAGWEEQRGDRMREVYGSQGNGNGASNGIGKPTPRSDINLSNFDFGNSGGGSDVESTPSEGGSIDPRLLQQNEVQQSSVQQSEVELLRGLREEMNLIDPRLREDIAMDLKQSVGVMEFVCP